MNRDVNDWAWRKAFKGQERGQEKDKITLENRKGLSAKPLLLLRNDKERTLKMSSTHAKSSFGQTCFEKSVLDTGRRAFKKWIGQPKK